MAAGDAHAAAGQNAPARRPARASDPSVYPQSINAAAPAVDPDTRDISVSPSLSTSSADAMDIDIEHPHKRRRATIVGVQRVLDAPHLGREIDALSATQLVALSSELVRRVAGALPMLAAEAEHSAADVGGVGGSGERGDPLDLLFRHVKHAMLERQSSSAANINGAVISFPSSFPLDFSASSDESLPLPFTIRKQVPLLSSRPITDTVQALSLSEMSLLSRVSAAMQRIAPLSLAAREWDNVGILLEAAKPRVEASRVFMTIDLTPQTLSEALDDPNVGVIVSYHPPIFAAWKSLTMSNLKQSLVLKCAAAGVSIYSPHTSLDSCSNGINDWLAGLISEKDSAVVTPITPASVEDAMGQENVGSGRIVEFSTPQPLDTIVAAVKQKLGLDRIRVARAVCHSGEQQKMVSKVAICAGSGASVVGHVEADVYFTGEMGHHDMLAAISKGTSCILAEHSNSERGYLKAVLAKSLQQQLDSDNVDASTTIVVSLHDRDPVTIE
ncbi:NIF3-domain-containing protein [Coemansia reversa NRRL 1564]|uniref:NIF3-domain-containing protein n=1 Tax=Coemansia reversa (strain ATCC 12441 / NRRL 1564) TaxID=763665 RepID=A0A2G5B1H6_COERN|nr:NIF3-domain-containing protein [Coemansia reversa NRRL 1564]|eukprot:PIA12862.1 NIF3-domain-containing protein [Coemansia reversa NRRL 1564]